MNIKEKFNEGIGKGYTHMFVLQDIFDGSNHCFYVTPEQEVDDEIEKLTELDTYRLIAIYNYALSFEKQEKVTRERTLKLKPLV